MGNGEKRKKIYEWRISDDIIKYNPYYNEFIKSSFSENNISDWNSIPFNCKKFCSIEKFLRWIPHVACWPDEFINKANVLFISNEPGLTNCEELYKNLLEYKNLTSEIIAASFHRSMLSWLSLTDHENLGHINGETGEFKKEEKINRLRSDKKKFKEYGKIGYFLKNDREIDENNLKCIHIDLFPFAQNSRKDPNSLNCKNEINKWLRNNNFNLLDFPEKICDYCKFGDNSLTCKVIKNNFETIKKFCESTNGNNKKYIFIVGNRVLSQIRNNNIELEKVKKFKKDYSLIVYSFLKYITQKHSDKIEDKKLIIRISSNWISFDKLNILKILELKKDNNKWILIKI